MAKTHDIAIIGGGLAGLTFACLAGQEKRLSIVCLDQAPPAQNNDLRTTAISYGSRKILEEAGIWQNLSTVPCAIEEIKILDGDSPLLLDFLKEEADGKIFGWIVENSDLKNAMMKTLISLKNVEHRAPVKVKDFSVDENSASAILENGETVTAKLVVGADGRNSFTREWMDVPVRTRNYKQRAIVFTAAHEHSHDNVAVEHFRPEGPFAILPMADSEEGTHRSSVVFTEHGPEKNSFMRLSDADFNAELNRRFPENYGRVELIGRRAAHPLSLVHAASYIAPRMALIADAAHAIHPVAGQGLNLGFRDVKALADLVKEAKTDPGEPDILEKYQQARRFDNMSMVAVTDGLVRLFSNDRPGARYLRRAGLKIVSKLPAAKRFFISRAMGDIGKNGG
ncbi:MAG: UbiH/UbiF/VisC/COQ6 family ubiquinone biosynthesis hydroxylase [Micavibrio sp.]|nr:UbiH/UbiF/VisC/COQ6 family ubiquinone biosynthesis hydroxylase [Micavibrio sp.]